jgi:yersiniabactin nonribosomal peptide synthetase
MFHFQISHLETGKSRLHFSLDLLILDAWSGDLLMREIFKAYSGHPGRQPEFTFREYIEEEKKWYQKKPYFLEKAEAYWAKKLPGIPAAPPLPYRKPLGQIKHPTFKRLYFELSAEEIRHLTLRSKQCQLNPTTVFCTAFLKLLSTWSGVENLTVNMTLFNRLTLHKDAMNILGDFTNVALITFSEQKNVTFIEEAKEIQNQIWEAVEHRAKNGVELIRDLGKKNPGKAIMPIVFTSLLGGESASLEKAFFPGDVREVFAVSQTPQVVIDHQIYRRGKDYSVNWDVVEDAFDPGELNKIFELYEKLLRKIITGQDWDKALKV